MIDTIRIICPKYRLHWYIGKRYTALLHSVKQYIDLIKLLIHCIPYVLPENMTRSQQCLNNSTHSIRLSHRWKVGVKAAHHNILPVSVPAWSVLAISTNQHQEIVECWKWSLTYLCMVLALFLPFSPFTLCPIFTFYSLYPMPYFYLLLPLSYYLFLPLLPLPYALFLPLHSLYVMPYFYLFIPFSSCPIFTFYSLYNMLFLPFHPLYLMPYFYPPPSLFFAGILTPICMTNTTNPRITCNKLVTDWVVLPLHVCNGHQGRGVPTSTTNSIHPIAHIHSG